MPYSLAQIRSLVLDSHKEYSDVNVSVVEEFIKQAITTVQLLNLPALRTNYIKMAQLNSWQADKNIYYNPNLNLAVYRHILPNDYLSAIEESLISLYIYEAGETTPKIRYGSGRIVSYGYFMSQLGDPFNINANRPLVTVANGYIYVFPFTHRTPITEIAYIRKVNLSASNVDLPDEYIPQVITHTMRLLEESLMPQPQVTDRNISIEQQGVGNALQSIAIQQNKGVSDDIKNA